MLDLSGHTALVSGGSAGIGLACARAFADLGCQVILAARNQDALTTAMQSLSKGAAQRHQTVVLDTANVSASRKQIQSLLSSSPISILLNNSAGPPPGAISTAEATQFLTTFQQQLLGAHELTQMLLPRMRETGYGRIINIISTSVKEPLKDLGVSNTIRAAVAAWAKTLAGEVAADGITVNNILPGYTETARLEQIIQSRIEKTGTTRANVTAAMLSDVPIKRFAQAKEVAAAAAFLASPQASYITGINLPVDGGRTRSL